MRFQKGQSGNPKGKAPGLLSKANRRLAKLVVDHGFDPAEALIRLATDETQAPPIRLKATIELFRCLNPVPKSRAEPITFAVGTTHSETCRNIINGIAKGEIPPDSGAAVLSALRAEMAATELDEVEARLRALEKANETDNLPPS